MTTTNMLAMGIVALTIVVMAIVWLANRTGNPEPLENIPAYDAIDALIHRSSEEGRELMLGMGDGLSGLNSSLGDSISLTIQRIVLSRSVFNDRATKSFSGDGALANISQLVVKGAYDYALAPELFYPQDNQLSGTGSLGWMAGLLPQISHSDNASLILGGALRPEQFLLADIAEQNGIPFVIASGSPLAQAAFFVSSAPLTLGEDYYLPSIGKLNQKNYQNSAKTMNWLRIILAISLIVAAILKLSGVLP